MMVKICNTDRDSLHVTFPTINTCSIKTTIHPLFIVTKQHITLTMILMQILLHEDTSRRETERDMERNRQRQTDR